jgi:hypothetical protein
MNEIIVRTHRGTLWVLIFDCIHPVTSGTKMINFTLNTPYNNFMRGSFRAFIFFKTMHNKGFMEIKALC